LDEELQLWRLILYVTYYHLGSAEFAWTYHPHPFDERLLPALPTGVERRGMRGNAEAVNKFIQSVFRNAKPYHSLKGWVDFSLLDAPDPQTGWWAIRSDFEEVWGAGSWSSYKWADLLKNVMDYKITANDIGLGGGSVTAGPVPGLALLTGETLEQCATNRELQEAWYQRALRAGVPFTGLDQFETALCDFNSLAKGTYYVGHDIDMMTEKLPPDSVFWAARRAVFPAELLGEMSGWNGRRMDRLTVYRDTGRVLAPTEAV
jgi:hypothetical protein